MSEPSCKHRLPRSQCAQCFNELRMPVNVYLDALREAEPTQRLEDSSAPPAGYDAKALADWLDELADETDAWAEDEHPAGSDEAIANRGEAIKYRQCAELIRAALSHSP